MKPHCLSKGYITFFYLTKGWTGMTSLNLPSSGARVLAAWIGDRGVIALLYSCVETFSYTSLEKSTSDCREAHFISLWSHLSAFNLCRSHVAALGIDGVCGSRYCTGGPLAQGCVRERNQEPPQSPILTMEAKAPDLFLSLLLVRFLNYDADFLEVRLMQSQNVWYACGFYPPFKKQFFHSRPTPSFHLGSSPEVAFNSGIFKELEFWLEQLLPRYLKRSSVMKPRWFERGLVTTVYHREEHSKRTDVHSTSLVKLMFK